MVFSDRITFRVKIRMVLSAILLVAAMLVLTMQNYSHLTVTDRYVTTGILLILTGLFTAITGPIFNTLTPKLCEKLGKFNMVFFLVAVVSTIYLSLFLKEDAVQLVKAYYQTHTNVFGAIGVLMIVLSGFLYGFGEQPESSEGFNKGSAILLALI